MDRGITRKRRVAVTAALCAAGLLHSVVAAPVDELAAFQAQRERVAGALTEPIAACEARRDTQHPVFYGCIDWHSSVHGMWALTAYTRATGDARYRGFVQRRLDPERLKQERAYLARNPDFEMPYGRAWFLRLAIDHQRAFGDNLLTPFADDVAESLVRYYTRTRPDPSSIAYDNASWALINLHDYGLARGNRKIVDFVLAAVRERYVTNVACPLQRLELDQPEFMAVCSNWAWLVQLVLPPKQFEDWLHDFLPPSLIIAPITRPRSAHEAGLNFSRAWGFWRLYQATNDERFLKLYLDHFNATYSRPAQWKGDYHSVAHWVAQFGMFALMVNYYDDAR